MCLSALWRSVIIALHLARLNRIQFYAMIKLRGLYNGHVLWVGVKISDQDILDEQILDEEKNRILTGYSVATDLVLFFFHLIWIRNSG